MKTVTFEWEGQTFGPLPEAAAASLLKTLEAAKAGQAAAEAREAEAKVALEAAKAAAFAKRGISIGPKGAIMVRGITSARFPLTLRPAGIVALTEELPRLARFAVDNWDKLSHDEADTSRRVLSIKEPAKGQTLEAFKAERAKAEATLKGWTPKDAAEAATKAAAALVALKAYLATLPVPSPVPAPAPNA